eukprot:TRINITY_DN16833_c0_g1_i1.p1 TRINITY_DN16833_c0_g1~~TRINITY_DN16833_c0_g1_i1.p1  ORF type:complete len:336 (+),score=83.46 TRINITY_DN16833_c0_g1_i1:40-1047(+)
MEKNKTKFLNDNKKKNAKKACHHCKKSHRKCDDKRPCSNCIKYEKQCYDQPNLTRVSNNIHPVYMPFPNQMVENSSKRKKLNEKLDTSPTTKDMQYPQSLKTMAFPIRMDHDHSHGQCIKRSGFELIKRDSDINEEEKLKKEIEMIEREIREIDEMNLPDNITFWDPIELFIFKEKFSEGKSLDSPPHFAFPKDFNCGSMFIIGIFNKQIDPQNYNAKYIDIQNISVKASTFYGMSPEQMIGKSMNIFTPKYSDKTWMDCGLKIADLCKKEVNFLRIIDYGRSLDGRLFAYDSDCAVICDGNQKPSFLFVFIKKVNYPEQNLSEKDLCPRITYLY